MSRVQALQLAAQHRQAGRPAEAEGILRQVLRQRPNDSEALHQLAILAYEAGKLPVAVQLIERALGMDPNVHIYHANIAEMYRRLGQVQKAIAHGQKAVALKVDAADAHNNLGIAHFDVGDYETAVGCYDRAIALRPRFAEAISNRANALRQMKRHAEAEAEYRRAIVIAPSYAEAHNNLGSVLRDQNRHAESESAYRRAVELKPHYVEAMNNLILAQRELKKYDEAIETANAVLKLDARNADALSYLGAVYVDQKRPEAALEALRRSLTLNPGKAETHNTLGRAFFAANEPEKAIEAYRRAIALKADLADPHNNLGNVLKELGRFDEALGAFDKAIAIEPDTIGVYVNLADAKRFRSNDDKHLAAIEGFLRRYEDLSEEQQMHAGFAAAKAYDDLKRYGEGFPYLIRANALKRKTLAYDEPAVLGLLERIAATFSGDLVQTLTGAGFATRQPIFVLGMPRSGTTLVEQILASHPQVRGAGEVKDLSDTVNSVRGADGHPITYPGFMTQLSPGDLAKIGEAYAARLAKRAAGAERITDKMPSNFYFLGLIHLALPGAKIVHTKRNPVDTCVSCFSKLFAGEQNQTYDLAELGRYYRGYHKLMEHWRAVLPPGAFLDVQYEDVVTGTEAQARRILDHCGLSWTPRVLDFHRTERPVKTASARQVRQPIYASSVARWRNYERFLAPLLAELGDLG